MRHWSLLLSGLFFSALVLPSPAQARPQRNIRQAFNLAQTAIYRCYQRKDLEECENLNQIQATLSNWCNQGDREACRAGSSVQGLINIEFRRQAAQQAYE
jgi:hypothetical protein